VAGEACCVETAALVVHNEGSRRGLEGPSVAIMYAASCPGQEGWSREEPGWLWRRGRSGGLCAGCLTRRSESQPGRAAWSSEDATYRSAQPR
jgi:hypothetical protein